MADEPIITEPFDPFLHLAFRYRCPGANISITSSRFVLKRSRCATKIALRKFQYRNPTHTCRSLVELNRTMRRSRCANSKTIAAASFKRSHVVHAVTCFKSSTRTNSTLNRAKCNRVQVIAVGSWKHSRTHSLSLITYASMSTQGQRGCVTSPRVAQSEFTRAVKKFDCRVTPILIPVSAKICNGLRGTSANELRHSQVRAVSCRTMPRSVNFQAEKNCASNMHLALRSTFNWQVAVRLMSCRESITLVMRPAFKNCTVAKLAATKDVIHSMYRRQPVSCKSIMQVLDSRKAFKICNGKPQVANSVFKRRLHNGVLSCRAYPSSRSMSLQRFRCGTIILGTAPLLVYGRVWGGVGLSFTPRSSGRVNGDYNPE